MARPARGGKRSQADEGGGAKRHALAFRVSQEFAEKRSSDVLTPRESTQERRLSPSSSSQELSADILPFQMWEARPTRGAVNISQDRGRSRAYRILGTTRTTRTWPCHSVPCRSRRSVSR